jgi:hypothetical protein
LKRDDKRLEILLTQYRECWSDKRNYDQMIWQTPAVSLAIISILIGSLISNSTNDIVFFLGLPIILLAFLVALVGVVQLRKHRFSQIAACDHFDYVQNLLLHEAKDVLPILFKTSDILRYAEKNDVRYPSIAPDHRPSYRTWLDRRKAYEGLFFLNWLVMWELVAFAVWWSLSRLNLLLGIVIFSFSAIIALTSYTICFDS